MTLIILLLIKTFKAIYSLNTIQKTKMKKVFFLLIIVFGFLSFNIDNWEKVNSEGDIIVYNTKVEGDKFKKSKVETTINYGSINKAEKILKDISNYAKWQPKCESSKSLKIKGNKITLYLTFGAPWPVSDRDLILESTFIREKNKLIVKSTCKPKFQEKNDAYVRITYSESFWEIEQKDGEGLFLRNTSHSNPGGNIPAWLSSSAVEDIPLELMQKFVKLLK